MMIGADGDSSAVKRRRSTRSPASRKKVRISGSTPTTGGDQRRRKCSQQTLTQIDFVQGISYGVNDGLSLCEYDDSSGRSNAVKPKARLSRNRDSTLTQMDFFNTDMGDIDNLEDQFLREAGIDEEEMCMASSSLSASGANPTGTVSPNVPRPLSKHAKSNKRNHRPPSGISGSTEHISTKTRRTSDDACGGSTVRENRRRSARLSAAANTAGSKPCNKYASATAQTNQNTRSEDRLPHIVQDSAGVVKQQSPYTVLEVPQNTAAIPSTPVKQRSRIPSSQSPESITKRSVDRNSTQRQPLSDLSTNIRQSFTDPKMVDDTSLLAPQKSNSQEKTPQRKSCILKVPPRTVTSNRGQTCDSQHEVWSILPTSSVRTESKFTSTASEDSDLLGRANNTQKLLPDIESILGIARKPQQHPEYASTSAQVLLEDLDLTSTHSADQGRRTTRLTTNNQAALPETQVIGIPEPEDVALDELSEFGTPVANDTQYVRGLDGRLSSPSPRPKAPFTTDTSVSKTDKSIASIFTPGSERLVRAHHGLSPSKASPLPPPRLVEVSPNHPVQLQKTTSATELPTVPSATSSTECLSTRATSTQVPLNDTVPRVRPASSPVLPEIAGTTAMSMKPAEMPHPSQLSTQAPSTQGFFHQMSCGMQAGADDNEQHIERVVIKDSSSTLSSKQPGHNLTVDCGAFVGTDQLPMVEDSDEDLDLDPSTWKKPSSANAQSSQQHMSDETTQTPTQKPRHSSMLRRNVSSTDESPIITKATTRAERDAQLEVIELSSQPLDGMLDEKSHQDSEQLGEIPPSTIKAGKFRTHYSDSADNHVVGQRPPLSSGHSESSLSLYSPSPPRPLKRKYSPIAGFDNDTQSDYTQNGHVTAAYIHRMREEGLIPDTYVPKPFKPKNWDKNLRSERQKRAAALEEQDL